MSTTSSVLSENTDLKQTKQPNIRLLNIQELQSREETAILHLEQISYPELQEDLYQTSLRKLFDFYQEKIVKPAYVTKSGRNSEKKKDLYLLNNKECRKACNHVTFSYKDSIITKYANNEDAHFIAKKMIDLDYRHCAFCRRIMPRPPLNFAQKENRNNSKNHNSLCPCCGTKMSYVSVLIKRTKMKEALFKFEGY